MIKKFRQIGDEIVEFTPEEYAVAKAEENQYLAEVEAEAIRQAEKEAKRQELLAKLGITAEEAKLLLS